MLIRKRVSRRVMDKLAYPPTQKRWRMRSAYPHCVSRRWFVLSGNGNISLSNPILTGSGFGMGTNPFQDLVRYALVLVVLAWSSLAHAEGVTIAAASSLQFALHDVAEAYERETGEPAPGFVFGSSGNLYRQILQGAPFDIFFSARSELIVQLAKAGKGIGNGSHFGTGRLVLLSAKEVKQYGDVVEALQVGVVQNGSKIAIANPAHAPFGRAAKQVLESLQLWGNVRSSVVNGEQVSQATQFVVSGAVPYGFVSLSLALAPSVADVTRYYLVDDALHEPVELQMVRVSENNDAALRFYNFVLHNPATDEIFRRYGLR